MLDHEGGVEVGEQGGIVYRFEALRRTAETVPDAKLSEAKARVAAWDTPRTLPPLTGNSGGTNAGIMALNGFNVLASGWVLSHGLTLSNLYTLVTYHPPRGAPPLVLPYDGVPIALGVVPLVFSLALFALPAARALLRSRQERAVRIENARLAILREVLTHAPNKEPVTETSLRAVYRVHTGTEPTSKEITARVVALGGDVDVGPEGEVRYRFADLEAEAEALDDERRLAPEEEAKLGRVVFASDE
jgi:hypothetical protein